MRFLSLLSALALTITLVGCDPATPSGDDLVADQASKAGADRVSEAAADQASQINDSGNLAEMAFEYLKTGDERYLERIWVTPELMKRIEEISGEEVPSENLDRHQDAIVESARLVRKEAEKSGVDWTKAKLVKAEWDRPGELTEYAPHSGEDVVSDQIVSFEVYLTIESGQSTFRLRLDDCLSIDGKHVVGDCFLAPTMVGW
jgi:hypothetical protein